MRLFDRVAAWFGYVPAEKYDALSQRYAHYVAKWLACDCDTRTGPQHCDPTIIVSADFKRGIPWS